MLQIYVSAEEDKIKNIENVFPVTQCTSDIDNSVAKRSDTAKTVVY